MKKMLVLLMALTLVFMLTACGSESDESARARLDDTSSVSSVEEENDVSTETNSTEESPDEASTDDGWRSFLKEYEEWVDKYIAVLKKYKANPSDLSILTEYTSLVSELADWTEKADDISDSIVDAEDAIEYSAELARIAAKIADAAGDL